MPTLTLKFKENIIKEYEVEKGNSLTIGRRNDNGIMIENLAVSGYHAKIDCVGDGFLLSDLQSKNGTFVNDQKVSSHWLQNGDAITIGKHSLIFACEGSESSAESHNPSDMDQTMVMDTEKQRALLAKNAKIAQQKTPVKPPQKHADAVPQKVPTAPPQKVALKQQEPPSPPDMEEETPVVKEKATASGTVGGPMGIINFLAGGNSELILSKKLIKIGKNSSSDIVVGGLMVGQTAATISKRPNGYYLSYVGGMAKVKINNVSIKDSVLLKEFDTIEIGSAKLQFSFKEE